ncbi:AraC-like DNA-binding protein [Catenuloplanes nepalensis]|uniref:AraC-like DNA-binding protein n=1 Tax=Catenuloplanes nepalensis TaxID=587533 RepID=A0ABT9N877_9ACTN|nr:helix-turn-helix transcriptional regulator [Catenuloplanes nepalensis]MDP9799431.1 AraC-like DNA-binding protein [Catenuloplanes nepalensis]
MEPLTFDSSDVPLIEATLGDLYSPMRLDAAGGRARVRLARRVMAPGVAFDDLDCGPDLGYRAAAQEFVIICDVVAGAVHRDLEEPGGGRDVFGPGDQFLFGRPGLRYSGRVRSARLRLTLLDPALFTPAIAAGDDPGRPIRVLDHRPFSPQAALGLQRAVAHARDHVSATGPAPQSPLVIAAAVRYLAANVLHTYPNTAVRAPLGSEGHDTTPSTVQRAVAFIEANPDLDLTLDDIARAARVTPRMLQLAFRRHLAVTPMAHLRRVRLDRAHASLHAATSTDGQTVTGIAARWGVSTNRFAEQYQDAYGESPSRTLRRQDTAVPERAD